jgi:RecJ-like exonuclease
MKRPGNRRLYEECPTCEGTGRVDPARLRVGDRAGRTAEGGDLVRCPACVGRGFVATGLTVGQVTGILAQNDELRAIAQAVGR